MTAYKLEALRAEFKVSAARLNAQVATIERYLHSGLLPLPPPEDVRAALIGVVDTMNHCRYLIGEIEKVTSATQKKTWGHK